MESDRKKKKKKMLKHGFHTKVKKTVLMYFSCIRSRTNLHWEQVLPKMQ